MHFLCWAQSSKYQRFSRMCCRNWRKLLWKYVLEHTIVWRNVLRPNSRTQSWKYVCGTAHRNAAFRAQQRQHRWASSQHFTHFSPRNFWLPPSVALPVDYLEHSGGVGLIWGWENIWGNWIQINLRQLQQSKARGSRQHFTHFTARNFWLPPSVTLPVLG